MPGSVQNPPIIGRIPWHRGRFVAAFAPPAFCSAYSNAMLFYHYFVLSLPLIMLGFAGYALVRWGKWPKLYADALSRFVLALAMPALLFATMSDYNRQPRLDGRLLLAFFGACLIVFVLGRLLAARYLKADGVARSVFALGGIFSNIVLLGIPIAKATLGERGLPAVALVLVFNSLILWTLVSVSAEWEKNGSPSLHGLKNTVYALAKNPLIGAILAGSLIGTLNIRLPDTLVATLQLLSQAASPLALVVLGMGLAEFGVRTHLKESALISGLKLVLQPLLVFAIARLIGLPKLETQVVVMLGCLATGTNAYMLAREFETMEGPVAGAMALSTLLGVLVTPLALALTN